MVEVHRACEATATPRSREGANLSEVYRTIRGFEYRYLSPLILCKRTFLVSIVFYLKSKGEQKWKKDYLLPNL